jgi:DNA-binding MarR family transcriptional regulator
MRSLAEEWECDASNATWIVDRLERLGLAERRAVPHDRRVKLVVLTAKGERTKAELLREFHTPPADLLALSERDLKTLERLLAKLPGR